MLSSYKHFAGRPLTWIGSLLVVSSLGSIFGTYSDLIQGVVRKVAGLPDQETSQALSVGILVVGVVLVIIDQCWLRTWNRIRNRLLAVRHASFNSTAVPLLREADLPEHGGPWHLELLDCDLTRHLAGGNLQVSRAVLDQEHVWNNLEAQLRAPSPPQIAYYGVAHIPLQIWAGRQMAHATPLLFELERKDSSWRELRRGAAPNLHIRTQRTPSAMRPSSLVVRVAVSYPVELQDVCEIVAEPFDDVLVTVSKPAPDLITHYAHAEALAAAVRRAIDTGMARIPTGGTVHLFFAGPMSVGFSIGRLISPSVHPAVIAYNYTSQTSPKYLWGLRVNSNHASELVVEPAPIGSLAPPMKVTR
ncbi:SAVED domain-containing protein [Roseomonas sp. KE2513]|uniref:SAVED domain-containing protein n=1 Tax=Roseomonas sp. KE2513 TaxID=2479202 RepID=UPI0018DFAD90|nr:SAVED domain-containing protein [Roseomonas sp. KE2513]MBI0535203.1 SAVED domain-containing protein [Roseomonas sp. KE2513]